MSDRDTKLIRQARSTRLSFPDDESKQAWLPLLLEAYAIVDAGVHEALRREQKQGRTLACHKGCAACCRSHTTIPIYPLELIGITWLCGREHNRPGTRATCATIARPQKWRALPLARGQRL